MKADLSVGRKSLGGLTQTQGKKRKITPAMKFSARASCLILVDINFFIGALKNLFIRFNAEYEVTAVIHAPAEEAEKWEDAGVFLESEPGKGDALMSADLQVRGEFSLIYDPQTHKISSHNVSADFV